MRVLLSLMPKRAAGNFRDLETDLGQMEAAMTYTILVEKNERGDGWAALAPGFPGLLLIGATREALLDDAPAAIADYLDAPRHHYRNVGSLSRAALGPCLFSFANADAMVQIRDVRTNRENPRPALRL